MTVNKKKLSQESYQLSKEKNTYMYVACMNVYVYVYKFVCIDIHLLTFLRQAEEKES